jgi:hypothetical protein
MQNPETMLQCNYSTVPYQRPVHHVSAWPLGPQKSRHPPGDSEPFGGARQAIETLWLDSLRVAGPSSSDHNPFITAPATQMGYTVRREI